MLIDGTSDKIQFKLNAAVTTNQLIFTANYNNYTSTSATLVSNNGTSNNTTAVDIVTSPGSSQQNQLRYCSIYNADTVAATVLILVYDGTNTRQVFRCTLEVGGMLQYQLEKGWEVLDVSGNKEYNALNSFRNSIIGNVAWRTANASSIQLTSTSWFTVFIGRAEKAYTSIDVCYNVAIAGSSITYAEIAIYSDNWKAVESMGQHPGIRRGWANIATTITSTGAKKTTVTINENGGITQGDYMTIVFSVQATGVPSLTTHGQSDSTALATQGSIVLSVTGGRPSLVPTGPYLTANPTQNLAVMWRGT